MHTSRSILSIRNFCSFLTKNPINCYARKFSSQTPNDDSADIIEKKFAEFKCKDKSKYYDILPPQADVVIVGGGAVGLSIAYWLKNTSRDGFRIVVVEKDPTYSNASSMVSMMGLKQQYGLKQLIQMSKFSAEFFRDIHRHLAVDGVTLPNILYNHQGFLTLATEENKDILVESYKLQRSLDVNVVMMDKSHLQSQFPWMDFSDIELGCYGQQEEGWFNPALLIAAYKIKCAHYGVEFCHGEVVGVKHHKSREGVGDERNHNVKKVIIRTNKGEVKEVDCSICINAGGPWAADVSKLVGIGSSKDGPMSMKMPIVPRKKFLYSIHCPGGPGLDTPIVLDTSGVFIRREDLRNNYICGVNLIEDSQVDGREYFENIVKPAIVKRIPVFKNLELTNTHEGLYDYNFFDGSPIMGNHPKFMNFLMANGFNGQGAQLSPAIGRAYVEFIVFGGFKTIDFSDLYIDRVYSDDAIIDPTMFLRSNKQ